MPTSFCSNCFALMVAQMRKLNGDDPTISLDPKLANFSCKVPIYEPDEMGRLIVKIWDCKKKISLIYSQEEWERKKREGEI